MPLQPRVVMALKVRDEHDIIESNLRFHASLGVDAFVITDNGSIDGTREVLDRWERAGLAHVRDRDGNFLRDGREWLTEMARFAATELEADWVIHADADEFWWPLGGSIKDALASIPPEFGTVLAPRGDFVGRAAGEGRFEQRLVVRESRSLLRPKVAHRADPEAFILHDGGHDVVSLAGVGSVDDAARPVGRAVHRAVLPEERPQNGRLSWAPSWPLRIFHFPVRSEAQFSRRIELSFDDDQIPDRGSSALLRDRYEQGRVPELYARLCYDDNAIAAGLESGDLVTDTRLRDMLSRCPDPLTASNRPALRVEAPEHELEAERLEVERDVMQAQGRAHLNTVIRLERRERARDKRKANLRAERRRQQTEKLTGALRRAELTAERRRRRIRKLERNLERERSRPLARLRRALKRSLRRNRGAADRGPRSDPAVAAEPGSESNGSVSGGNGSEPAVSAKAGETMPLGPADAPACPPGWRTGPPDFVGVGAQRSGSTWWFRALESHPRVVSSDGRKELHYFDRFWDGRPPENWVEGYRRLFPRPPGLLTGEWTPRYMFDQWTLPLLRRAAPDARLLVMLRDPVERFLSGLARESRIAERAGEPLSLAMVHEARARSRYRDQLAAVLDHYERERVLVLQYEACLQEPLEMLNRTFGFLELEPLEQAPEALLAPARQRPKPTLEPELRAELVHDLREDVAGLAELCPEIDVSLWPSFATAGERHPQNGSDGTRTRGLRRDRPAL